MLTSGYIRPYKTYFQDVLKTTLKRPANFVESLLPRILLPCLGTNTAFKISPSLRRRFVENDAPYYDSGAWSTDLRKGPEPHQNI